MLTNHQQQELVRLLRLMQYRVADHLRTVHDHLQANRTPQLEALYERGMKKLARIDAALEKADQQTYGICDRCSEGIPFEHLRQYPHHSLCQRCAREPSRPADRNPARHEQR